MYFSQTLPHGFYVGKYISLEAKIAKDKDLYYDAAYKDFEDRFEIVEDKLPAVDMVRKATMNKIGKFTKQDIRELCPSLSISSIEGSLRKLVSSEEIKREGTGKSTYYIRLQ